MPAMIVSPVSASPPTLKVGSSSDNFFKAESNVSDKELVRLAKYRLSKAHADLIVANDVGRKNQGFQSDENEVFVIDKQGRATHLPHAAKSIIAERIVSLL